MRLPVPQSHDTSRYWAVLKLGFFSRLTNTLTDAGSPALSQAPACAKRKACFEGMLPNRGRHSALSTMFQRRVGRYLKRHQFIDIESGRWRHTGFFPLWLFCHVLSPDRAGQAA